MLDASAAPIIPQPNGNIKSQSKKVLVTDSIMVIHMASLGAPSKRIINTPTKAHIKNRNDGKIHSK